MRRPALIALLSAALTLGLCAGASAAGGPTGAAYVYRGHSAQGIPVRLAAQVHGARWFRYRATMTCNDGTTFTDDFFSDDVAMHAGRFSDAYASSAGAVRTKVTGHLQGRRASGTIRIIERYSQLAVDGSLPLSASGSIVCDSHTVKWSARA